MQILLMFTKTTLFKAILNLLVLNLNDAIVEGIMVNPFHN